MSTYNPSREEIDAELKVLRSGEGWETNGKRRISFQSSVAALLGGGIGALISGLFICFVVEPPDTAWGWVGIIFLTSGLSVFSVGLAVRLLAWPVTREARERMAEHRLRKARTDKQKYVIYRLSKVNVFEQAVINELTKDSNPLQCIAIGNEDIDKIIGAQSLLKSGILERSYFSIKDKTVFLIDDVAFEYLRTKAGEGAR